MTRDDGPAPASPAAPSPRAPSTPPAAPDLLVVARVLRPHGVQGELKCRVITDFPGRFRRRGLQLHVGDPPTPRRVRSARVSGQDVFLRLDGIETLEQAQALRGQEILVAAADAVRLPEGEFYWHQVIGLRAEDPEGTWYGTVRDILETGANHVYVVHGPAGEILIPATKEVVQAIDPEHGRLVFTPLPGLIPDPPRPRAAQPPVPHRRHRPQADRPG